MEKKVKRFTKKRPKSKADTQASSERSKKSKLSSKVEKDCTLPTDDYEKGGIAQLLAGSKNNEEELEDTVKELFDPSRTEGFKLVSADPIMNNDMSGSNDDSDSDEDLSHQQRKQLQSQKHAEAAHKTQKEREEQSARTVFIGNLPPNVTKKVLLNLVKEFGDVESVRIRGMLLTEDDKKPIRAQAILKKHLKKARSSIAYIVFKIEKEARRVAYTLNNSTYNGRTIRAKITSKEAKVNPSNSIFVGNVPRDASEDDLRSLFTDCGEVDNIRLPVDKRNGQCKGCAFIQFKKSDGVSLALQLTNVSLSSRILRISRCKSQQAMQNATEGVKKNKTKHRSDNDDETSKKKKDRWSNRKNNQIFVRHIPKDATEEQIKNLFKDFGEVEKVKLVKKEEGTSVGFIHFMNGTDAERVINKHTVKYGDQKLPVFKYSRKPTTADPSFQKPVTKQKDKPTIPKTLKQTKRKKHSVVKDSRKKGKKTVAGK